MVQTDPNVLEGGVYYGDKLSHYVIYSLVNLDNGKRYIGRTKNPKQRIKQHFIDLKAHKHSNPYLNEDAGHPFGFEILEDGITFIDRTDKERYYIFLYKTYEESKGYNRNDPCIKNFIKDKPMDIDLFVFLFQKADDKTKQIVEKYLNWAQKGNTYEGNERGLVRR